MSDGSEQEKRPGGLGALKARITGSVSAYRDAHPWLRHVLDAWGLLNRNNGNQYAAAITYFSFLALFPLLLLAVSVTGFVLHSHPSMEQDFFNSLTRKVPGEFGNTLKTSLQTAIDRRAGVGVVGVLGVALAGGAWIGNLRAAVDGVWGRPPAKRNFVVARVINIGVLGGLGIGLLVSLALTAIGTSLTDQILSAVGLGDLPGAHAVLKVLGIAIAAAADSVMFWWVLVRLPQAAVPTRIAVKGAILASVGFEVLKIVGTFTIAHTAHSPTAGPFAGLLAVLIWIQLVARYMLFACAWMATLLADHNGAERARASAEPPPAAVEQVDGPSPAAVGATLVGAGAIAGAAATWALRRPHPRRPDAGHRPRPPKTSAQPW